MATSVDWSGWRRWNTELFCDYKYSGLPGSNQETRVGIRFMLEPNIASTSVHTFFRLSVEPMETDSVQHTMSLAPPDRTPLFQPVIAENVKQGSAFSVGDRTGLEIIVAALLEHHELTLYLRGADNAPLVRLPIPNNEGFKLAYNDAYDAAVAECRTPSRRAKQETFFNWFLRRR